MRFCLSDKLGPTGLPLAVALILAGCGGPTLLDLPMREAPQDVHPGDAARGLITPIGIDQPGTTSQLESLFARVCAANPNDTEAAIIAAVSTGLFDAPVTGNDAANVPTTRLLAPDGGIEVVIQDGDQRGISCAIGNADGSETYVLLPDETA